MFTPRNVLFAFAGFCLLLGLLLLLVSLFLPEDAVVTRWCVFMSAVVCIVASAVTMTIPRRGKPLHIKPENWNPVPDEENQFAVEFKGTGPVTLYRIKDDGSEEEVRMNVTINSSKKTIRLQCAWQPHLRVEFH